VATQLGAVIRRKQAEEEVRRSQRRYETLVNSIDGIVWEAEPSTFQFRFVSPGGAPARLHGRPVAGGPAFWGNHIHPDDGGGRSLLPGSDERAARSRPDLPHGGGDGREVWLHDS